MRCAKECDHFEDCSFGHNANSCELDAMYRDVTPTANSVSMTLYDAGGDLTLTFDSLPYQIRTHTTGLCFELFEHKAKRTITKGKWKGKEVPAGWVSMGIYPRNIERACEIVMERALLADENTYDLAGALERVRQVADEVKAAVNA